jgi:hypothetical protein
MYHDREVMMEGSSNSLAPNAENLAPNAENLAPNAELQGGLMYKEA